jgi:ribosomal protein S18 acetylase RimI-like enzyme
VIDLYVRSDSRRLGVGRCLMEEAASVCRDVGGSRVLWSVYKINEPAFSFYEDLGASYCDDETFMKLDV